MKPRNRRFDWWFAPYGGLGIALMIMIAIFSILSRNFVGWATLTTIINAIPDLTIVSVGMTLILILGGIDLSVGSVLALAGSVFAVLMLDYHWPIWASTMAAVFTGTICGLINGTISVGFRIPSFIVTLGMLEMARGAAYQITNSETKYIGTSIEWISQPISGWMVSPAFLGALFLVLGGEALLRYTVLGRIAVAIGTNVETVKMSGIRVFPYSLSLFGICGGLCGIAAIIQTSRLSTADPNAGTGLELSAIAACVIGGTSLRGGKGSVIGTFLGVLIVSVLQSGLAQLGVPDAAKRMITGCVIIVAVVADSIRSWRRG